MTFLDAFQSLVFHIEGTYEFPAEVRTENSRGSYTEECQSIFEETGVPCLASDSDGTALVLYFHGNSENLQTVGMYLNALSTQFDAEVITFEMPGYWRRAGEKASQPGIAASLKAAHAFAECAMRNERSGQNRPIVFVGYSLGGALALDVASTSQHIAGVLLIATFFSLLSVPLGPLLGSCLCSTLDEMQASMKLKNFPHPLVIVQGEVDHVVSISNGRALAEAAGTALYIEVAGADHRSVRFIDTTIYSRAVNMFLRRFKRVHS